MNYPLKPWETLILSTISPDQLTPATVKYLGGLIAYSAAERDKLRTSFIENFYASAEQKKMEFYVQFNQNVLIKLLDTLYHYKQQTTQRAELTEFYDRISNHVSFILDFIEDYFGKYFDRTAKVPAVYLATSRQDILHSLTVLDTVLAARKEFEPALRDLLLSNFTSFCKDSWSAVTFHDLYYQKTLMKELLDLEGIPADIDARDLTLEMLFYMNFNHPRFILYYLQVIIAAPDNLSSPALRLVQLQRTERHLRLQREKPQAALRPGAASVKAALLAALEKEASYLHHSSAIPAVKNTGPAHPKSLVSVPFRGAEIYLLHKSFIDSGGAPQEIYKTLLEKTAAHLGNKTQKGFSAESLVKYSDKVDPESKETVKRFLQKMIRNIESYD